MPTDILGLNAAHLQDRERLGLGHPTIVDITCIPDTALAGEDGLSREPSPYPRPDPAHQGAAEAHPDAGRAPRFAIVPTADIK